MVNELLKQFVVRSIKELMFNNELTYRKSLNENFDYKELLMTHINIDRIVQSIQSSFVSTFQFGQQFSGYTPVGFIDGLKKYYADFNSFHIAEKNAES